MVMFVAHRPDSESEPFWGHWVRRDDDVEPQPPVEATPAQQRGSWLSSRWFGGCLAAGAALGLALGVWARLEPGPTQFIPDVNTVTPRAPTVTSTVTRRATHVVRLPVPAPPPVTEWATAPVAPPVTVTVTPPRATVTVRVPTTVTVTAPATVTVTAPPTSSP